MSVRAAQATDRHADSPATATARVDSPHARPKNSVVLMALAACLASRLVLERTMWGQMLLQLPLLLAVGAYLAVSRARSTALDERAGFAGEWNRHGAAGLVLASGIVALWMIPRLLDAALEHPFVDLAKMTMLVVAGAIGARSWHAATAIVRVFALGNVAWMTATVGLLLVDSRVRLCASYGANDQQVAGYGLVLAALFLVVAAFVRFSAPVSAAPVAPPAPPNASGTGHVASVMPSHHVV